MTKLQTERGRSIRLALALAMASSCVPGVHSTDNGAVSTPVGTGGGEETGPSLPMGPPPDFGPTPTTSAKPVKPIIGGTLVVLPDARTAIAADPDRDRIFVADYRRQTLVAELPLQAGDEPGRVAVDGDGRVHVALRGGGAVVTLLPNPWHIASRRAVCTAPRGLAYDAGLRQIHVACADGDLVSLPVEPDAAPVRRLSLDRDLRDVIVDGQVLLVSRFRSAEVLTIDRDGKVVNRQTPGARRTFRPKETFDNGGNSSGVAGTGGSSDVPESLMTPSVGWKLVSLRVGEALLLHQRGLNDEVSETPGGYGSAQCGGIVETTISRVGALGDQTPGPSLPAGPVAVDLAVSLDRKTLAVVSPGQARTTGRGEFGGGQVLITDVQTVYQAAGECDNGMGAVGGSAGTGGTAGSGGDFGTPDADVAGATGTDPGDAGVIGDSGSSSDAIVAGDASAPDAMPDDELPPPVIDYRQPHGEAVAVAWDIKGHLLVQTREPASIQVVTADNQVVLSFDSRADTGHDIFHTDSGGGIACASCHPEGGDDGRVWKFRNKQGVLEPRRTQNLRGGVLATAPFHWNGDLASMGPLMDEVFVQRMRGPKLGDDFIKALGTWMNTIPAMPKLTVRDQDAVTRGSLVFAKAGCTSCHGGNLFTNNTNADVGTGRQFQVPSLRGVVWRAPYMHDGCAATLADRFSDKACSGGDHHGVTSNLTPAQISDLTAFVETL